MRHVWIVLLALSLSTVVYGQKSAAVRQLEQQRKEALADIEETNKLLQETAQTAKTSLNRLNLLSKQILSRKKVISLLNQELDEIEKDILNIQGQLRTLKRELGDKQTNYGKSMRGLYKRHSSQDKLLFILSAESFSQSMRRMRYLREYADWQKRQANDIVEKQAEISRKQAEMEKTRAEKRALLGTRQEESKKLESEEASQKEEVQLLNKRQKDLKADLQKKRRQAEALNRQIEKQIAEEIARAEAEAKKKAEQERLAREKEEAAREAQRRAVPASDSGSRFRSLLDQIAAQETVLKEKQDAENKAKAERAAGRGTRGGNNGRRGGRRNDRNASDNNSVRNASESRPHSHRTNASNNVAAGMDFPNPDKQGKGKKRKGGHNNEEDHYSRMAREAEEYSREKVLEEARAAVEEASRESTGRRKKRKEKREREAAKAQEERKIEEALAQGVNPEELDAIKVSQGVTVQELAEALDVPANDIIKRLFLLGTPLTMTQSMSDDLVELVADDLGRQIKIITPEEENTFSFYDDPADLKPRPPVVTVRGHVDHGKTSLLDAIRHTGVAAGEAGGITQAIGASQVMINDRKITFIDTPGHATFTAMRARGAKVTDIVILIVAADDGVMPQTIESINHAKAAGVPIVVAVNKIDKPGANPDRVRQELTEYGIIPEEWGGQNMFVNISAKQKIGIDDLLETVLLQADVLELKANPDTFASGNVLEAKLDKGRGSVATVLVTRGTLHVGDTLVAGLTYGRVRAMLDPKGNAVTEAGPSDAVEILGLQSVPNAGDEFRVFEDEREARALADERSLKARIEEQSRVKHVTLENLFETIADAEVKELNLIIKADVQGSIEALQDSLDKMDQSEVRINTIHSAVGAINETDVVLADASNAIIIGFGVRPDGKARSAAEREGVEIRCYDVIYKCLEELDAARIGMLKPTEVEVSTGTATVLDTFKVPKVGIAAGVRVEEGEISATDSVRLVRDGIVVFNGKIASMRHYKDEAKSLKSGSEGGIGLENFQDIKPGDQIEGYRIDQVARTE